MAVYSRQSINFAIVQGMLAYILILINITTMKNVNDTVRRQDRLLDEERARELLAKSEYGVLSMVDEHGGGYGVPLNFVWDGEDKVYFHSAIEGHKLLSLRSEGRATFCIIGQVHLLPDKFTTEYESVLLRGRVHIIEDDDERWRAIKMLLDKLSSGFQETGMKYSAKSFPRVAILRLDVDEWSGKCKKMHGKG
jgi:nitroimidazol reductase NimA-like FMN-containing flavoprotein (pyridoxamine 5'-phosphate oxidase superfamily)